MPQRPFHRYTDVWSLVITMAIMAFPILDHATGWGVSTGLGSDLLYLYAYVFMSLGIWLANLFGGFVLNDAFWLWSGTLFTAWLVHFAVHGFRRERAARKAARTVGVDS